MSKESLKLRIEKAFELVKASQKFKICIGKEKKPIDKENEIIFHIDF